MIHGELVRSPEQEQKKLSHKNTERNQCHEDDAVKLPYSFGDDAMLSDPVFQSRCGSCWANSTTSMLQDRLLKNDNKISFQPNIQDALGTSMNSTVLNGCSGGDPFTLLDDISKERGLTSVDGDAKLYLSQNICLISNEQVHRCSVDNEHDHESYMKCINETSRKHDSKERIHERTNKMKKEIFQQILLHF